MEEYAGGIIGWERLWRARLGALGCGSAVSTAPSRRRQSEPRHPCCGLIRLSVHSRASPAPRRAGAGASGRLRRRAAAAGGAASELSAAGRFASTHSARGGAGRAPRHYWSSVLDTGAGAQGVVRRVAGGAGGLAGGRGDCRCSLPPPRRRRTPQLPPRSSPACAHVLVLVSLQAHARRAARERTAAAAAARPHHLGSKHPRRRTAQRS